MLNQILIVDDHEAVRRGIRSLLASRPDWKICGEAVDGLAGVEKARQLRPDVVIMDISMPRMDGLEATRIIRRELPQSKVIIISQNDPAIAGAQAREVDAAAYIAKSDLARELLPTVSKFLAEQKITSQADSSPHAAPTQNWLAGGGTLGRLIREHDWSQTSLGPIERWPQSLKTSVNLILNSQHPMWVGWGKDAAFLYNDAYIQVLSLAKHPSALGKPAAEVWPEIWDICGPLADKVFQSGEASFLDDVRLFMNRGDFLEETYYSFSYSPIRDESGAVAGLFCPSTEVTPKVVNARRLGTLSELSADALVQKTTDAACASVAATLAKNPDDIPFAILYLIDSAGNLAQLEQACGVPKGIEGLTPESVDFAEGATQCFWPLAEAVRTGQSQVLSVKGLDGLPLGVAQQKLTQAIVLPVTSRGEGGTVGALVAGVSPGRKLDAEYRTFYELIAGQIATAIQNVRAAEEERKRLEALAEIDRAKTTFFSNVSHEFRTPLTLMLGPVEDLLAKSHTGLSPAAKSQLELVNRNGSRLLRLVNTLLDFSRIEAGRMQAIYQATDLASFTIELASVFRSATEKAGLRLELDCPKIDEPVFVDRGMWEKIVLNLISNAFKFTFEGSIAIALHKADDNVELRVRDTGVGIPANEIPRLFDRFHRIENTRSRTHEGSGIGLALVQELVKLHGGSVRVESAPGEGSAFIVSLPRGRAHLPEDRIGGTRTLATTALGAAPFVDEVLRWLPDSSYTDEADEIPSAGELIPVPCPPFTGGKAEKRPLILVADDNSDMRQYLVRLLGERYEVQAVPDGVVALEAARERTPELVLSDVMMPNLDGFGLLHELRADPRTRTLPIILLSARAGEESRVEGMEHGADDYLIKPFSARELLARVQTHLEMARVRQEAAQALRVSEDRSRNIVESIDDGFIILDRDWRITYVNPRALEIVNPLRKTKAGLEGQVFWEEFPGTVGTIFEESYRRAMRDQVTVAFESFYSPLQRWFDVRAYPSRDAISLYFLDVTERKLAESTLAAERNVLEQIALGTALLRILETLALDTEAQSTDGMLCSVLLFDEAGKKLRHGAGPSLPRAYCDAIDGVSIGPKVGSCGTAAHLRKPVFVEDISSDPLWADYKELAATHGLAACSSTPIISSKGALLGTLAMYYRRPHQPSAHDCQVIGHAARLAAIAIERNQDAEALRHRTEQFETLLNEAPVGAYLVDADFRIREMNPAAQQLFGNPGDLIGMDWVEWIRSRWPQAEAEEILEKFRHTLETGVPHSEPEWNKRRLNSSKHRVVDWQINRIALPDGRYGVVCYFRDITRQVQAREAIVESEERLRLAQRVGHSGTWERNCATDEIIFSPELEELYGLVPGQGTRTVEQWRKMFHPEDLPEVDRALAHAIETRGEFHVEFRINRADGPERWLESTARIFFDEAGKPVRIVGVSTDITERRLIEERERQMAAEAVAATAKFRAVFEQTPVFAGIMALDGTVMDANKLSLEACGYRSEDVLGRNFWETGWWRRSPEVQAKIQAGTAQAAQGIPYRETLTYHWADDTERLVDLAVHPIHDEHGKILFLHPTGVDITDLKRAEEKYRTLAETLDAEVRSRTTEVVQQSEQLRDLSSRLLQAQDEERRHIARELHDSAGQILAALGMTLAQAASGNAPKSANYLHESQELVQQLSQEIRTMSYLLHPPLLDETGLSEALRWYIQGLSERNGLEIALEFPEHFERLSREMELVMFRLVQECLTNIHRHSGSKAAVIRIGRSSDNVTLEVQDKGKGISAEKLAQIQSQGSGVGIRGMRERARHFGGHMMIESNHKGTKISFQFPASNQGSNVARSRRDDIGQQPSDAQPVQVGG